MKFINMYFIGYVVLILGLTLGLWQAGILQAQHRYGLPSV